MIKQQNIHDKVSANTIADSLAENNFIYYVILYTQNGNTFHKGFEFFASEAKIGDNYRQPVIGDRVNAKAYYNAKIIKIQSNAFLDAWPTLEYYKSGAILGAQSPQKITGIIHAVLELSKPSGI